MVSVGDRVTIPTWWAGDTLNRKGTVVYIHPRNHFYTVRFDTGYCESFYFKTLTQASEEKPIDKCSSYDWHGIIRAVADAGVSTAEVAREMGYTTDRFRFVAHSHDAPRDFIRDAYDAIEKVRVRTSEK